MLLLFAAPPKQWRVLRLKVIAKAKAIESKPVLGWQLRIVLRVLAGQKPALVMKLTAHYWHRVSSAFRGSDLIKSGQVNPGHVANESYLCTSQST